MDDLQTFRADLLRFSHNNDYKLRILNTVIVTSFNPSVTESVNLKSGVNK